MKILINALSVTTGGGLTSFLSLIPALSRVDSRNEYIVLRSRYQQKLEGGIPETVRQHVVSFNSKKTVTRLLYEQVVLPLLMWRLKVDWLYSLGNVTTLLAPCKVLLVIENANPYSTYKFDWPFKERVRKSVLNVLGRLSALRATKIRFLSKNSRDLISRRLGIPKEKAVVIPHGVAVMNEQSFGNKMPRHLPLRYILTVTNIGPHKNLHTLLDAFEALTTRHGYSGSLVIVGEATYEGYYRTLLEQKHRSSSGERIVFTGWVEPDSIPSLYAKAELFVFPSVEETFGLPVLEAMAHGVPVLVPEAAQSYSGLFLPYREVCGDAAVYFDPLDADQLCEQMQRLLQNQSLREHCSTEGKRMALRYRLDQVATTLVDVFEGSAG